MAPIAILLAVIEPVPAPATDWTAFVVAIATSIPAVTAAVLTVLHRLKAIHLQINSRMDQLLEAHKRQGFFEGQQLAETASRYALRDAKRDAERDARRDAKRDAERDARADEDNAPREAPKT